MIVLRSSNYSIVMVQHFTIPDSDRPTHLRLDPHLKLELDSINLLNPSWNIKSRQVCPRHQLVMRRPLPRRSIVTFIQEVGQEDITIRKIGFMNASQKDAVCLQREWGGCAQGRPIDGGSANDKKTMYVLSGLELIYSHLQVGKQQGFRRNRSIIWRPARESTGVLEVEANHLSIQWVIFVATKYGIQPRPEGPMLGRNALPSTSAHDQGIDRFFRCMRRDTTEECQVFWDVPWHRAILTDAIPPCCSDNDC